MVKAAPMIVEKVKEGEYLEAGRRLVWSEYALKDKSVFASLDKKLNRPRSYDDRIKAKKLWEGLSSDKKREFLSGLKKSGVKNPMDLIRKNNIKLRGKDSDYRKDLHNLRLKRSRKDITAEEYQEKLDKLKEKYAID